MEKGIQELFDELIKKYNLRAITIEDITWYGINDLPIREPRKTFSDLRKQNKENFVKDNTKLITNSDVLLKDTSNSNVIKYPVRNFDKVNNAGETFGNFKMVNYLIMNSRLGVDYKIDLIEILDVIRTKGYYIDNNITNEQLEDLELEISRLKYDRLYGSTEIVKLINVPGLLSSSLFVYMDKILRVGSYSVKTGNVNRKFVANEDFDHRAVELGIARRGTGNNILFFKEFADRFNNCENALEELRKINAEELKIKEKGIKNKKPF